MSESPLPADLSYSADHEWVAIAPGTPAPAEAVRVGITSAAVESLGEIVFIELPEAGTAVTAGEVCGEIESTKAVSELFSPVSGEVVAVNATLADTPGLVSADPFGAGWLFTVRVEALGDLRSATEYASLLTGGEQAR
ncbi:glycine cleavage system protein GcvH [Pseudonocardia sp.]|uniref:glycine cleavage system protein GcvH n=1 Tax=Pseudonocardia sp. TaxID=60912 RepID=UPI003D13BD1F